MFSLFVVVEALKQDLHFCVVMLEHRLHSLIQCDACDKWTHWYVSQLYFNKIMPVPHFIFETQCIQPILFCYLSSN